MRTQDLINHLTARRDAFRDWLENEAPYTVADQRHLDAHTPEQAYWHHGYQQALADIVRILSSRGGLLDSADTSRSSPPDG